LQECLLDGAKRWINIAGFNFQPSELAKLGLIIFFASLLADIKEKEKIKHFGWGLIFPLIFLVPIVVAILIFQNHFSATFIICSVTVVQMLIAGTRLSHFILLGIMGVFGFGIFLNVKNSGSGFSSFRMTRIQTWLNPWTDITGDGWQIIQSLYAIGSGGLFGAGLGQSKQKYLYLPEPQNDFIFAVLAEELGFIGCLLVIILFLVFIWRGIVISMRAKDTFGSLIAIGITTLIGLQAIINIAVVTNTMPVTGMELPFFSYGGTALMINLFSVGILLNISRSGIKKEK
jgi:cell division protein FtsW